MLEGKSKNETHKYNNAALKLDESVLMDVKINFNGQTAECLRFIFQ